MPCTVQIDGDTVGHSRLVVRERVRADSVCSFVWHDNAGTQAYNRGDTLTVTDGGTTIFSGAVVRIQENAVDAAESGLLRLTVTGRTGEVIERRIVQGLYVDTAAGDIIKALNTAFSLGLTVTAVDDGPVLSSIRFDDFPTAAGAFDRIAQVAGDYVWAVTRQGNMAFKRIADVGAALHHLTDSSGTRSYSGLVVDRTVVPYFNRVVVSGGRDAANAAEKSFTDYDNRAPVFYAYTDRAGADTNGLYEGVLVGAYNSYAEAYYAARAFLDDNGTFEQVSIRYETWDDPGSAGGAQTVSLAARNLDGTFILDTVERTEMVQAGGTSSVWRYRVRATEARPARPLIERAAKAMELKGARPVAFTATRETSEIDASHQIAEWTDALVITTFNQCLLP